MSTNAPEVPVQIDHRGSEQSSLVREAPSVGLTAPSEQSVARPSAAGEPELDVAEIQGNLVAGFNKDFATLLFLTIDDQTLFKTWLGQFHQLVASAEEVISFNRLFKRTRDRRGYTGSVKASWINIAFSHAGLSKLTVEADAFTDASFRSGVAAQSAALGDPTNADAEGHPDHWLVRDGDGGADVLIIVAADALSDLEAEVAQIEQLLYSPRDALGRPMRCGAAIIFKQEGRTQLGALAGHEHFGFLDGISQPGIRGRISHWPNDVLTPRQNPNDPDQGKPGQDLLWPGEFIFGYQGQDPKNVTAPGANSLLDDAGNRVAPDWAKDGAYLVFRRLRQDVHAFHQFLHENGGEIGIEPAGLGAKLIGRWASGAPIIRAQGVDEPELGDDDCANNNFEFQTPTAPIPPSPGANQCQDATFPTSPGDKTGDICPFAAHIRKSYPRDDVADPNATRGDSYPNGQAPELPNELDTQTHRLLRRGIPFGPSSRSTPAVPVKDDIDRGLLFMAYMTSIQGQFEFVTKNWVNNTDFKDLGAGIDPILGQNPSGNSRSRVFNVRTNMTDHNLETDTDWVIPTGGGYFFAPSIKALRDVLAK
jgi:Dyp-type peroxidase family